MIWLRNAMLYDGKTLRDGSWDICIEGSRIAKVIPCEAEKTALNSKGASCLDRDLRGCLVCPGFVDIHAHFRDPGQTWREDIESGSKAAAVGGFTHVVAMPNTDPPVDDPSGVRYVAEKGRQAGGAVVLPAGAATVGRQGRTITEMIGMAKEGAVLFTDDGSPVLSSKAMRIALLYLKDLNIPLMEHPEEVSLSEGGQMNEGRISALCGLKGIPRSSEIIGVDRAIALCKETKGRLHLTHVSTKEALESIRKAKAEGLNLTCDVTPHHLVFDDEMIVKSGYSPAFKVNPPLRTKDDVEALWEGLKDGTVDAIATDHAPYHVDEKDLTFEEAKFGIASLECAVAVVLDEWDKRGKPFDLSRLLGLFTAGPGGVIGMDRTIKVGGKADITVIDLNREQKVDVRRWKSKARISPYDSLTLKGWPVMTVVAGEIRHAL
ncbi:dihydroorotase [Acetomicrobium mobile DSM 13181]|uniref:Dihydroorotase n=1 Tax=Acetomicrobium mobile (strain ATCC BAA-54 / DSM 13181 / JCM 12221 / NGA) TaxID=891968 RepID=I4BVG9_ACEMN|nr:dihydroorotase [Acetomicrobium mobile]AFM21276.1 dihydroorotase [Acetomicrobium mobile DSM 13181]